MSIGTQTQFITGGTSATAVKITNLNITSTGSEFSHSLTNNLKQLMVRSRVGATIQFAFTVSESGTKYATIEKKAVLKMEALDFSSKVLYLQADKTGIVEILELY